MMMMIQYNNECGLKSKGVTTGTSIKGKGTKGNGYREPSNSTTYLVIGATIASSYDLLENNR